MDWPEENGNVAAVVLLWYCGCGVVVAAVIAAVVVVGLSTSLKIFQSSMANEEAERWGASIVFIDWSKGNPVIYSG